MKRRDFLKSSALSILSLAALTLGCGSSNNTTQAAPETNTNGGEAQVMDTKNGKKILITYFSWSGNTKALAEELHKQLGGDLVPIVPENPYSETYSVCVARAKQEQLSNARPAIKTKIPKFEEYDYVLVGYPNWWGSLPMPVVTFLESYKWHGKKVAPFFTHGGGGEQRCDSDFRKYATGANVGPYLCLAGSSARSAQKEAVDWIKQLGL
ncbi:MAG: flavodoxin [Phascolarctobacterium sp.]|nr:flavodoxin [Phascolarctobacterium sp.]